MQTQRLFEIVYILLQQRKTTAKELAEHFEVSVRTIYRDIDALTLANIPIYTNKGKHGGIFLTQEYVLQKSLLSDEEQLKILSALHSQQIADHDNINQLLTKLSGIFQKKDVPWIAVDFSYWNSSDHENQKFNIIKDSILIHHVISFIYFSASGNHSKRIVEPLQLLFKSQAWYLVAYCRLKKEQRIFKISRIRELTQLEDSFQRVLLPLQDHIKQYQNEQIAVTLKFKKASSYLVYEEFSNEQIEEYDDYFIIHTTLTKNAMLYNILLSFGPDVTVLKPECIKQKMEQILKEILENYKHDIMLSYNE